MTSKLRYIFSLILLFVLSFVITNKGQEFGFIRAVEYVLYDSWHQLSGKRYEPENVVLVTIDDETLATYPDDPLVFWTPYFAKGAEIMRKVGIRFIGLDFMFSISPEQWLKKNLSYSDRMAEKYSIPIRTEINEGKLVMVASVQAGHEHDQLLMPSVELLLSVPDFDIANHVGYADLQPSSDGAVRDFVINPALNLSEDQQIGAPQFTLGGLLAKRALIEENREMPVNHVRQPISFTGPPGTIPRLKLKTLLQPNAHELPEVKALKGKIAIIGGEYQGMSDSHITPYSSSFFDETARYMTGPEIQANIVETLLSGNQLQKFSDLQMKLFQAAVLILCVLAFNLTGTIFSLILFGAALAGVTTFSYQAFEFFYIVPVAGLMAGILFLFAGSMLFKYVYTERESRRVASAFGRYVSPAIVDEIVASGTTPELGGIKREISVLFSDIRNFTTISERLNPEEVVEMLNTYFERACNAVLDEGGTIDKFIGDAIMVQFGAPVHYDDHADRALRAAVKIREVAKEFESWMEERFGDRNLPRFGIGIGINSGYAVIGNIGSSSNMDYTAIGDVTNAASRIESKTKELKCVILASKDAIDLAAKSKVNTGKHETVKVKGKDIPLELFEIVDIKAKV